MKQAVVVIAAGGTIASQASAGGGYRASLGSADLIAGLGQWNLPAAVEPIDFSVGHSYAMTIDAVCRLAQTATDEIRRPDAAAVVITQGTAALEEVSYLLDLLLAVDKPVVVTGAMIAADKPGYDGERNLLDAVRVASEESARRHGVLVCMAGEVHAAREVQKLHGTSLTPLVSWPSGPVALADADRIVWLREPYQRWSAEGVVPAQPVDVISASLGCDGRQMRSSIETGALGLVIEGFPGGGGVTPGMMDAVVDAVSAGIPVVAASRSPLGRMVPLAAGGSGPRDLANAGAIATGDLTAAKARLLLMCGLGAGADVSELRDVFARACP